MKIKHLQSTFLLLFIVSILIFPVSVSAETKAGLTPSSPFYFFDIAFEKIGLFFTLNTEKRIEKYLKYSEERLSEAEKVAKENKPKLVEKAINNYEKNISLATEESRTIEDKTRAEELLSGISESTSKHQAILVIILDKVPEEAKEAILKAIEVSKRGQEKALKQVLELKEEVKELKEEIEELKEGKDETNQDFTEKARLEAETAKARAETEKYKLEVERLRYEVEIKKQIQAKEEENKPKTVTLPSGAIVDESGNILNQEYMDKKNKANLAEEQNRLAEQRRKEQEAKETAILNQKNQELQAQIQNEERILQLKNSLIAEYDTKKLNLEKQIIDRKSKYYSDYDALSESFKGRGVTASGVQSQYNNLLDEANKEIELLGIELEKLRIEYLNKINTVQ